MTEFWDMTRSEFERRAKAEADEAAFERFGPRCWTCCNGSNFDAREYPYALSKDVTYCKAWRELMEKPHEPSKELEDCWEG